MGLDIFRRFGLVYESLFDLTDDKKKYFNRVLTPIGIPLLLLLWTGRLWHGISIMPFVVWLFMILFLGAVIYRLYQDLKNIWNNW